LRKYAISDTACTYVYRLLSRQGYKVK